MGRAVNVEGPAWLLDRAGEVARELVRVLGQAGDGLGVSDRASARGGDAESDDRCSLCEAVGRDYDTIYYVFHTSHGAQRIIDDLATLAGLGFDAAIGAVTNVWDVSPLEIIGSEVIPVVADF